MYDVVWTDHAYDDLADVWVAAQSETRDRIETALRKLTAELNDDPDEVGESRDGLRRIAVRPPLVVVFRVESVARTVRVNHVWRYGK